MQYFLNLIISYSLVLFGSAIAVTICSGLLGDRTGAGSFPEAAE